MFVPDLWLRLTRVSISGKEISGMIRAWIWWARNESSELILKPLDATMTSVTVRHHAN